MKLYETLAEEIANSIQSGTFRRGDRLPSVRQLSENRGISTATVYAAYYLLESRGLVEAQERSGYFVTGGHENFPPEVETVTAPSSNRNNVAVNELMFQILESARARDIVPLRVSLSQSSGLSMAWVGARHALFAIELGPLAFGPQNLCCAVIPVRVDAEPGVSVGGAVRLETHLARITIRRASSITSSVNSYYRQDQ